MWMLSGVPVRWHATWQLWLCSFSCTQKHDIWVAGQYTGSHHALSTHVFFYDLYIYIYIYVFICLFLNSLAANIIYSWQPELQVGLAARPLAGMRQITLFIYIYIYMGFHTSAP